ncbi:MAG: hypothetical protein AAFP19_24720, partial [Bacteroidota bacterium]
MSKELKHILIIETSPDKREVEHSMGCLIKMHYASLLIYVSGRVNKLWEDPEEICMDAFRKTFDWLRKGGRKYGDTIIGILRSIARNEIQDRRRKKKLEYIAIETIQSKPAVNSTEH